MSELNQSELKLGDRVIFKVNNEKRPGELTGVIVKVNPKTYKVQFAETIAPSKKEGKEVVRTVTKWIHRHKIKHEIRLAEASNG